MKSWIIGGALLAGAAVVYKHRDKIRDWVERQIDEDIKRARIAYREQAERGRLIRDYGPEAAAALLDGGTPIRENPKPHAAE